jgi:hypothetical protein
MQVPDMPSQDCLALAGFFPSQHDGTHFVCFYQSPELHVSNYAGRVQCRMLSQLAAKYLSLAFLARPIFRYLYALPITSTYNNLFPCYISAAWLLTTSGAADVCLRSRVGYADDTPSV